MTNTTQIHPPKRFNNIQYTIMDTTITQTGDGEYDWGVNFTSIEDDLIQTFVGVFWTGDGQGIIEIIWNNAPIVGNTQASSDLTMVVFLVLFVAGPYYGLKKAGYID